MGYRPSSSITTIHEHEVVTGCGGRDQGRAQGKAGADPEGSGAAVGAETSRIQALRLTETPHSMSSLSPRSSLSSLSPPCSPLVSDTHFMPGDTFAGPAGSSGSGLDLELHSRLAELELDSDEKQAEVKLNHNVLSDGAKGEEPMPTQHAVTMTTAENKKNPAPVNKEETVSWWMETLWEEPQKAMVQSARRGSLCDEGERGAPQKNVSESESAWVGTGLGADSRYLSRCLST